MKDLTSGNIYKNFIFFAFPMVLAGVFSQAHSTIDTIIAGKYIGDTALAAIGATSPLITFLSSVFWGFGTGFSVYLARLFGSKEYIKIKSVTATVLLLLSAIVLLLSAMLIIFRSYVLSFFKIDPSLVSDASTYFTIYIAGFLMILGNTYGMLIMNAFGISTFTLVMSVLSAVINILGKIVTITIFKLGILGLVLSTVVSSTIVTICYFFKLKKCFAEMKVDKKKVSFDKEGIFSSAHYALPNMIQQMIMYASGLLISPMINDIGKAASAAYTVTQKTYDINASVYQNSTKTVANYTSQACGANKYHLLKKGVLVGGIQSTIFVLPFLLVFILFPETMVNLFYDKTADAMSLNYSTIFLSNFLPFILINVVANLMHGFFRGLGEKTPLILSTLSGSVTRIVVSLILIPTMGMKGMYLGWTASWLADALVGIIFYTVYITKNKELLKQPLSKA